MNLSHNGLIKGSIELRLPDFMSNTVKKIYFQPPDNVNFYVNKYIKSAYVLVNSNGGFSKQNKLALNEILTLGPGNLLISLDKLVKQYQIESEALLKKLILIELIIWFCVIGVLILEIFIIFQPMIKAVVIQEQKLQSLAYYDNLTGAINRKPFLNILKKYIARAKREKRMLALFFIDLENFKQVNDIYGHGVGDEVLVEATRKINSQLRKNDIIARIGGDEFTLCMEIKSGQDAAYVAQKINKSFKEKIEVNNQKIDVTVSIGISIFPEDAIDAKELLKNSDIAMYKAKRESKNSFRIFKK